jgi:hypothetical protein
MGPGPISCAMNPAERSTPAPIMLATTSPTPGQRVSFGSDRWFTGGMPSGVDQRHRTSMAKVVLYMDSSQVALSAYGTR